MPKGEEEGIRVYLRIRPPPTSQQSRLLASPNGAGPSPSTGAASSRANASPRTCQYEVEEDFHKSVLHLHATQRLLQDAQRSAGAGTPAEPSSSQPVTEDVVNNTVVDFRYRFDRVFKPTATQEDVFNTVAKDCVASVLDGLNSTVFAYGQTGSGKTYSITGGTESYQDRGLIPRAMAMIYEEVARRRDGADDAATTYTITMSYLQIYNDKGQDLLNHGHDARTLEELPPVSIHEMEDDIVLKGLEQHSAPTLPDALNLLFLGDTNRLYCETPMNKTSSRSHCIFTVYIDARSSSSSTVRRSKLNLVDLAGSERVSKTGVSGTILTEAKHINLSLHFLEQVIVALSEKAKGQRDHIPYRNSFLTMVLRDSLGRNCKTAMLATAHVVASQVAETISTCQFAQRVAMIQQAPQVNVETDPVLLVKKLKAEVAQLKDEVAHLRANGDGGAALAADRVLSDYEKNVCRGMVDAFVQRASVDGDWSSRLTGFNGDMARMYYCYDVLRERLVKGGRPSGKAGDGASIKASTEEEEQRHQQQRALLSESEAQVKALRQSLQLKENELQMLLTVLKRAGANGSTGAYGGGGMAGTRYSAPTQTQSTSATATAATTDASDVRVFQFFGEASSPEADAELRRRIYHEAQQLILQLRQSPGAAAQNTAHAQPAMSRVASQAAAEAALTRVTTLAQQGQLTDAEAAAATEFLESKKGLQQQQQQRRRLSAAEANEDSSSPADGEDSRSAVDVLMDEQLVQDRAQALEAFKSSYEAQHKVEETKQLLKPKYDACKATAQELNACVDAIKQLKTKIQRRRAERAADGSDVVENEETAWLDQLRATKEQYNTHAAQLRRDKEEIDGMHAYLKHAQEHLVRDFERWFSARQQQVQLAVQQQQRHAQQNRSDARQAGLAEELKLALGASATAPTAEEESGSAAAATTTATNPEATSSHNAKINITHHTPGDHALPSPLPTRSYPSSAPVNPTYLGASTPGLVHLTTSAGTAGAVSISGGPLHDPASARAMNRLASLPAHMPSASEPTTLASSPASHVASSVSARTLDASRRDDPAKAAALRASYPAGPLSSAIGGGNVNGWMVAGPSTTITSSSGGGGGGLSPSPTRPFHLQPIGSGESQSSATPTLAGLSRAPATQPATTTTTTKAVVGGVPNTGGATQSNPFFPQFPSTGNAAADEQLAQLYRAREAMRKQLQ